VEEGTCDEQESQLLLPFSQGNSAIQYSLSTCPDTLPQRGRLGPPRLLIPDESSFEKCLSVGICLVSNGLLAGQGNPLLQLPFIFALLLEAVSRGGGGRHWSELTWNVSLSFRDNGASGCIMSG
jgi:hypothetical protein